MITSVPVILGFATLNSPFAHLLETLRNEVNPSISHLIHQLGMKHGSKKYTVFILTPTTSIRLSLSHYLGHHALPPTWEPTPFVETNVMLQRNKERERERLKWINYRLRKVDAANYIDYCNSHVSFLVLSGSFA